MQQNKHDALVRQIAEEMAAATHPGTWEAAKESLIEHFTPAAKVAMINMASIAEKAYHAEGQTWLYFASKSGLFPIPEQEADKP